MCKIGWLPQAMQERCLDIVLRVDGVPSHRVIVPLTRGEDVRWRRGGQHSEAKQYVRVVLDGWIHAFPCRTISRHGEIIVLSRPLPLAAVP